MKLYRITYQIDNWTFQPVQIWAIDEKQAIERGEATLRLAGHKQYEFRELVKLIGSNQPPRSVLQ